MGYTSVSSLTVPQDYGKCSSHGLGSESYMLASLLKFANNVDLLYAHIVITYL